MPNDELGYLAGVFDGEGTFGIWSKGKNKTRQLRVAVDMSDGDTVLRFLTFFKEGAIYSRQPKDPKHRLMYSWRVTNIWFRCASKKRECRLHSTKIRFD